MIYGSPRPVKPVLTKTRYGYTIGHATDLRTSEPMDSDPAPVDAPEPISAWWTGAAIVALVVMAAAILGCAWGCVFGF